MKVNGEVLNEQMKKYCASTSESERKLIENMVAASMLEYGSSCLRAFGNDPEMKMCREEALGFAITNAIRSWEPDKGAGFLTYFQRVWDNCSRNALKKERNATSVAINGDDSRAHHYSIDYAASDDDGDDTSAVDISNSIALSAADDYTYAFDNIVLVMINAVLTKKREYANKKTVCYPIYFFNADVAENIYNGDYYYESAAVRPATEELMEYDFVSSFTENICSCLDDLMHTEPLPISSFKPENTTGKKCGYPLIGAVYAKYFGISEPAASQHYKKYIELKKAAGQSLY